MNDWNDTERRELILLSEIGVLLHDIGKFSEGFIGRKVQGKGIPHFVHNLLYNIEYDGKLFLNNDLQEELCKERRIFKELKIQNRSSLNCFLDFVTLHHPNKLKKMDPKSRYDAFPISEGQLQASDNPETEEFFPWLGLLTLMADTLDSGIDKAFPQEKQSGLDNIWIASPFGVQKTKIDLTELENLRKQFQKELVSKLKVIDKTLIIARNEIYTLVEKYWKGALGETQIPSNDVRLHEHAISTATIFKAELSRRLIENDFGLNWYDASKLNFQLIGIQWSWWDVTGRAFKVPDIVGRSNRLDSIKTSLTDFFQQGKFQEGKTAFLPLGNAVYDDHNGIYFLIGSLNPEGKTTENVYSQIKQESDAIFKSRFAGEVTYKIMRLKEPTKSLTHLTYLTGKKSDKIEIIGEGPPSETVAAFWTESNSGKKEICQVCKIRPIDKREETAIGTDSYTQVNKCKLCKEIARDKDASIDFKREHNDLDKLKDEHRVALFSLKLDLSQWMNGKAFYYVLSNLASINDLNILKNILHANSYNDINFENVEVAEELVYEIFKHRKKKVKVYNKLRELFHIPIDIKNEKKLFAYYITEKIGTTLDDILIDYKDNTSIPGDLDFYETYVNGGFIVDPPFRFNIKIQSKGNNLLALEDAEKNKGEEILWNMLCRQLEDCWQFAGFDGKPDDVDNLKTALTMKYPSPSRLLRIINEAQEFTYDALARLDAMAEKNHFYFRHLVRSPVFLQVLLPANQARAYLQEIDSLYRQYFGLVADRLPIHARTVYFYYKNPLYIALDAARRMFQNNALLQGQTTFFEVSKNDKKLSLTFNELHGATIEVDLVTAYPKYFANYKIADGSESGQLKNISQITDSHRFECLPSTYDAIFLDTSTRRYDLFYDDQGQRPHYMLGKRPQKVQLFLQTTLYREIMDFLGNDDSKIKNLQTLLVEKHMNWGEANDELLEGFFEDCFANLYGKKWHETTSKKKKLMLDFAIHGYLFNIMEQKLFIEK